MRFQRAQPYFSLGIMAILTISLGVGCKPSGSQCSVMSEGGITGHTENKNGNPSSDDFPNCFRQDDSRDLVLTVNAPDITPHNVTMILWNIPTQTVIHPLPSPKIKKGTAEFRFRDEEAIAAGASKSPSAQHLGPGPYVETAAIATVNPAERLRIRTQVLTFGYDTYVNNRSECRIF